MIPQEEKEWHYRLPSTGAAEPDAPSALAAYVNTQRIDLNWSNNTDLQIH
ncbi:MAG: hypothetical protein H7144_01415 [Burkholderiales bacterium]|nr:hypothetical protein [Phycisphaerae bacterium]